MGVHELEASGGKEGTQLVFRSLLSAHLAMHHHVEHVAEVDKRHSRYLRNQRQLCKCKGGFGISDSPAERFQYLHTFFVTPVMENAP